MVAIIPARGGSKGLPGKNIKMLLGKPLIAYTIEAALNSNQVSRIIVSTDDNEIAKVAIKFGAEVLKRPDSLAQDKSRAIDVYKYVIGKLQEGDGKEISEFIVLQPTSPLRTHYDIDNAIKLFRAKNAYSVISFCQENHPISWHKNISPEGKLISIFQDNIQNRQEEKPTFFPNGAIYIFTKKVLQTENYFSEDTFAYIMERNNSVDIDYQEDFEYAEFLLQKL